MMSPQPATSRYNKVSLMEQARHDARRRSTKKIAIITVSTVVLMSLITAVAVTIARKSKPDKPEPESSPLLSSIKTLCNGTEYPESCYTSLSAVAEGEEFDPVKVYRWSVEIAMAEINRTSVRLEEFRRSGHLEPRLVKGLNSCQQLLEMSYDMLNSSSETTKLSAPGVLEDFRTWLSASLTYQDTCLDGFDNSTTHLKDKIGLYLTNSTQFSSNSLAILINISKALGSIKLRKMLQVPTSGDEFPSWLLNSDRRLLTATDLRHKAQIVVAADGSGKYKSINEALKHVPEKSKVRTVIYVKKGVYEEKVEVEKNKWNVLMVGDGAELTVITGSLNNVDGVQTFHSASLAVFGKGFIGMYLGVKNTAGPEKHQAVAMMASADHVVFYRCRLSAFQDTLYTHAHRQFYRECDVLGTVDFIFGNAAVVLQNCRIIPRQGMKGQSNYITAQGKTDKNQNTGISIHSCRVLPFGNLTGIQVYLGRPWKYYSTTVFMKTYLEDIIDPAGWSPWSGGEAPSTIFYAEFDNDGPGASKSKRVKWKGLKTIYFKEAERFTVRSFISGDSWLPGTGVPFKHGYYY